MVRMYNITYARAGKQQVRPKDVQQRIARIGPHYAEVTKVLANIMAKVIAEVTQ